MLDLYVGDFETTVDDNTAEQTKTEVWAAAFCEVGNDDPEKVTILGNIEDYVEYFYNLSKNNRRSITVYMHNLKFDGQFIAYHLLKNNKYKQAIRKDGVSIKLESKIKSMQIDEYTYMISEMGQWYTITIKTTDKNYVRFVDSLKLLPFSLRKLGKDFKTKHQKLEMEYKGKREPNCYINEEERAYIKNDVLVLSEALKIMFDEGHRKLTIGSCCLTQFRKMIGNEEYNVLFPDLSGSDDEFIRKSYRGGWCYVVPEKANKVYTNGLVYDVNSLYPSMMHSMSGNKFPYGYPNYYSDFERYENEKCEDRYHFLYFKCRFELKENYLPFVQIKNSMVYNGREMLKTSDVYNEKTGEYCRFYKDRNGKIKEAKPELCMTQTDFELFKEHYIIKDFEFLYGAWFYTVKGIFDDYINKYAEIKMNSKGAIRQIAKLFLNNLYGKLATSDDSSYKIIKLENNVLSFETIKEHNKKVGYIPCGSAITSYARNFTIRAAQKNYYGTDKKGFIYADTDSIHCDLDKSEIKGIEEDPARFCCWKNESKWDKAIFTRPKTYIEHIIEEDGETIEEPYYNIKCAGLNQHGKDLLVKSFNIDEIEMEELECLEKKLTEEEFKFIKQKRNMTDFKVGLTIPGKIKPKRIEGGVLLVDTTFKMRK